MRTRVLLLMVIGVVGWSCNKDKAPAPGSNITPSDCDPNTVYFKNDIQPLLSSNCAKSGCHDGATYESELDFTTYESAKRAADDEMMEVLTSTDPDKMMPPPDNTPLTADQITLISKWISQGAKNNSCNPGGGNCSTDNVSYANTIKPVIAANCNGCHSGGAPSGGIDLSTYDGVKAQSAKLYDAVSQNGNASAMPPSGKLSSCEISQIKAWIDAGLPNN